MNFVKDLHITVCGVSIVNLSLTFKKIKNYISKNCNFRDIFTKYKIYTVKPPSQTLPNSGNLYLVLIFLCSHHLYICTFLPLNSGQIPHFRGVHYSEVLLYFILNKRYLLVLHEVIIIL